MEKAQPLLSVRDLHIAFGNKKEKKEIVHGITFDLNANKILGIVGESGSGKSITSLAIMKLLPKKNVYISGEILFENKNILSLEEKKLRSIRGKEISMIFQEPMSALNPSMKCGKQVAEVIQLHNKKSYAQAKTECLELFKKVKLPPQEELYNSYPHQLDGGQMQRIMIAMAIACKRKLLITDEATTASDATVREEILE